jgi:uncharacterized protein (DUF305 family)
VTAPTTRTARLLGTGLTAVALALTGCSTGPQEDHESSASADAGATFNDADIAFAAGMIPHHEQAIEMAQLADERAEDPRITDLAARIEAAQAPEIDTLTGWLGDWGVEPGDDGGHGAGMGHDADAMGIMSEEDMDALTAADGAAFDRLFLEQMIEHHTGAVAMAETELADGEFPGALEMAEAIQTTQNDEIAEMEQLLRELDG